MQNLCLWFLAPAQQLKRVDDDNDDDENYYYYFAKITDLLRTVDSIVSDRVNVGLT